MQILDKNFEILDVKENITIADSFVIPKNKIGTAKGEAKLYVGQDGQSLRDFFGDTGFSVQCFLLKKDLLEYLENVRAEYEYPQQEYRNININLWQERVDKIKSLPERIEFTFHEQSQITLPRVYGKSDDDEYQLIRELPLPNITYLSIIKLSDKGTGKLFYYFKLFADYFGQSEHPNIIKQEVDKIEEIADEEDKMVLTKARQGQGKYREKLLEKCPLCPITLISDDRILIASHIKPWSKSNDKEKTDPYNGFMFTPTFDHLFDRGFISFTNEKRIILSPFLSKMTYSKLRISDNQLFEHLPVEKREKYLDYHREKILKKV